MSSSSPVATVHDLASVAMATVTIATASSESDPDWGRHPDYSQKGEEGLKL